MERYERQMGLVDQEALSQARVLVAGVGGLGSFSATYLALMGVGTIVLLDHDVVEESNLNRQFLYSPADIGRVKVEVAAKRLREMNPEIRIEVLNTKIDENFSLPDVDIVVDGLDSMDSRFILEDEALKGGIPYVFGAVEGYMGMVSFIDRGTKRLRDMMHLKPRERPQVLGATAGITAGIQSMEVAKYLSGKGDLLKNRLLIYDGLSTNFLEVKL